nr:carnosine N-methyltransferase-like isoform X2 [Tanacetum cinerariifolium]
MRMKAPSESDMYHQEDEMPVKLSFEDVERIAIHYGFELEISHVEKTIEITYTMNPRSMMQNHYFSAFWTMRKKPLVVAAGIDQSMYLGATNTASSICNNSREVAAINKLGRFNFRRTSLTGFPAQSIRSSNAIALESPTSLIHLESRKPPTAELFDVDSGRISIHHCEY